MSHSFIHIILSAVILDILQYGHPLLREECGPVVHINRDILSFLDDMQETLAQGGIGLAAPQVGRPIQLVTINIPSTDATTTWLEVDGCRSLPEKQPDVQATNLSPLFTALP